jgi:hypothetical protein
MRRYFTGLLVCVCALTLITSASPAVPNAASDPDDVNPLEKASAPARIMKIGTQNAKVFDSWGAPEIKRGDCSVRNGKLILYQNGSVEWNAEMLTKDPGDEWLQSFEFLEGDTVLGTRPVARYTIREKDKWLPWHTGGAAVPNSKLAGAFDRIQTVRWLSSC